MSVIKFLDGSIEKELKLHRGLSTIHEFSQTPSNLLLGAGGGRLKRGDPTFSEFEQETWDGGAFNEYYYEDQTRFKESSGLMSRFPKKLFLQPLWKLATGTRTREQYMPGSVRWISLTGANRAVAFKPTGGTTYDHCNLLVRTRGKPGILTFELRAESSSLPNGAVAKTVTKVNTDADVLDQFITFDWTGTQAFSNHWIVVYGKDENDGISMWEIGGDATGTSYSISDPSLTAWVANDFKPYFFLSDADTDVKWHRMEIGTNFYIVSQPTSGNSVIKKWNESTKNFDSVTPTGDALTGIVYGVAVTNSLAFLAKGTGSSDSNIMQFDHNAGAPRMYLDATANNKADQIYSANFTIIGQQLFLLRNNAAASNTYAVQRHNIPTYGVALGAAGDTWSLEKGFDLLGFTTHDNKLWIRTQNTLYSIAYDSNFANEMIISENKSLDMVIESSRFMPMISTGTFMYYPFSYSTEYVSGLVHKDIGRWRGLGMPDGRQGVDSAYCRGFGGIYIANDAGTGTSSVWFYHESTGAWSEEWRAWKPGIRIRNIWYQSQTSTTPARLWINCGNDLVYVDQPDNGLNPINDPDTRYLWGGYIVGSNHDFGAFQMPKFFESLDLIAKNLGQECTIEVDYQAGKDAGTNNWFPAVTAHKSPVSKVPLKVSDENELVYRLRFETNDFTKSPILTGAIMVGVARTQLKRQWNFQIRIGHSKDVNPMSDYDWLLKAGRSGRTMIMQSELLSMDKVEVLITGVRMEPMNYNDNREKLSAVVTVSVLEAVQRDDLAY